MRLAYTHHIQPEDTALNHVRQFVLAVEQLGHEVVNLPMNSSPGPDVASGGSPLSRGTQAFLKRHLRFYLHEPKELLLNFRDFFRLRKALKECSPDLLLVRTHLLTLSPILAARSLGLPVVLEINSPVLEGKTYGGRYLRLPLLPEAVERWNSRHADTITTVSSALAKYLRSTHGLPGSKVFVVPNGADLELFEAQVTPDKEVAEKLPPDSTVIGFVGSFHKWHGPEILAEMILKVGEARPGAAFLIVGDGPGRQAVVDGVSSLGGRVVFTGSVPHGKVPGHVALMDIGVMPESNFYGSPLKVLEWMAAGKAVVAPAYGPLAEIIDDEVHGLLFSPRSASELVEAVLRLIDDPQFRETLGAQAADRVASSLSWHHNAIRVVEACQEAVRIHRGLG